MEQLEMSTNADGQTTATVRATAHDDGVQLLRLVIDTIQQCNLRCIYCHPGKVWEPMVLPAEKIAEAIAGAEGLGVLEVVLSGGEVTIHPEFAAVMEATHAAKQTAVSMITNATRVSSRLLAAIEASNVRRICVSIDAADAATHATARGDNFDKVWRGLGDLHSLGIPMTVISVAHKMNYRTLLDLSRRLADSGYASQHHLCSPSFSGEARAHFPQVRLDLEDFHQLQKDIDRHHTELVERGVYVTFNSYWPATGGRSTVDFTRTLTLQQLTEQVRDTLVHIRPDGEVKLTCTSWGREYVGSGSVANVHTTSASDGLRLADRAYRHGSPKQLPREVEAQHKYQLGFEADETVTNALVTTEQPVAVLRDVTRLDRSPLLDAPFDDRRLAHALSRVGKQGGTRVARHSTGTMVLYEADKSLVTLVKPSEWERRVVGAVPPTG